MAEKTVSYSCPACSAPLTFNPGLAKNACEYCGTEFETKDLAAFFAKKEEDAAIKQAAEDAVWEKKKEDGEYSEEEIAHLRSFTCSACGAELVCDENTMATECCYCGNPTMIPGRFTGDLRPELIIPFKLTKKDAVQKLTEFYAGKDLLPDAFTENNRVEAIQGMFVPFWLFDTGATANAVYKATTSSVFTTSTEIITTTSYYRVDRGCTVNFARVPADGSKRMRDDFMDSIEPFDFNELVDFQSTYMTGYLADRYDVSADEVTPRIDGRIQDTCADLLSRTVTGYEDFNEESCSVIKQNGKITYAMLPVWILTTRYKDEPYTFIMNGQTGKMVGALPIDEEKKSRFFRNHFLTAFAASLVVLYALAFMFDFV